VADLPVAALSRASLRQASAVPLYPFDAVARQIPDSCEFRPLRRPRRVVLFRTAVVADVDCRCFDVGFETSANEAGKIRYLL
jgi:hypothetical protein